MGEWTATERLTTVGGEKLLVVDDQEALGRILGRQLTRAGYVVLVASSGAKALELVESGEAEPPIALALLDVVMPEMNGSVLADRLRQLRPDIKVLFMSGYGDDALERHGVLGEAFLRKPFSRDAVLTAIRAALDR